MTDDTTMPDRIRACIETEPLVHRDLSRITHHVWMPVDDQLPEILHNRKFVGMDPGTEYIRADLVGWVPVSERLPEDGDGSGMHDEITLGDIDGNRIMIPVAVFLVERSAAPEEWDQYTHWFSMGEVPE